MTDIHAHLDDITAFLATSGIDELELCGPGVKLRLARSAEGGMEIAPLADAGATAVTSIPSPGIGVFLDRHPWSDEPLMRIGLLVEAGASLGFLRAGTLLTAVRAPADGYLCDVRVRDGDIVGFGDVLAELEPASGGAEP